LWFLCNNFVLGNPPPPSDPPSPDLLTNPPPSPDLLPDPPPKEYTV
jgi:hypothetical protein